METRIEQTTDGESWNLYVNGAPAITHETYGVCCAIESAICGSKPLGFYSEAAEVADIIRRMLSR